MFKTIIFLGVIFFLTSCSNGSGAYPINKIPPKSTSVKKEKNIEEERSYKIFDGTVNSYDEIRSKEEFYHICFTYYGEYVVNLSKYSLKCRHKKFRDKICYKHMVFSYKEFERLKRACRRFEEESHLGSKTYQNLTQ